MAEALVAFGGNVGNVRATLDRAVTAFCEEGVRLLARSADYRTPPWGIEDQPAFVNLCIAASAAAFLIANFHPARIFLGDAGSVPLGFLAAALGILGWEGGDWAWWFPLLVFSPFIADASATLARRLYTRERVWRPHRDHYYQRLVRLGWGHRRTALAEYVLMLACGAAGIAALAAYAWFPFFLVYLWAVVIGVWLLVGQREAAVQPAAAT